MKKNEDLQKRLLTMNRLQKVTQEKEFQKMISRTGFEPKWFAPMPFARYDVWVFSAATDGNFRLLIDRETGDIFLSDYLL